MMVSLLLYAYCIGIPSYRKIEQVTCHSVAFRALTGNQHPDHDTTAQCRKRHLKAFSKLFVQVLKLCQKAGHVKLGNVALDGGKVRANASKHKAMSYGRMVKKEKELKEEVRRLLKEVQACDFREDALYGKGKRGEDLPRELRFKDSRLKKIQQAMRVLGEKALKQVEIKRKEQQSKENSRGRPLKPPSDKPLSNRQRNFTDPEFRIMKESSTQSFEECYNCETSVDEKTQVIIAAHITQQANDKEQLEPMLKEILHNIYEDKPKVLTADAGYYSEDNCNVLAKSKIDGYLATCKAKHREKTPSAPRGRIPKDATIIESMTRKLRTLKGRLTYWKRKQIVEPVFGQTKEVRGFRRFYLRGLDNVSSEWDFICLTHNLLKLFRSGQRVSVFT
jgi:hypothetical protein